MSRAWLERMPEQVDGDERGRFVRTLALRLRARLLNPRMSYPGHTGFSVADDEWPVTVERREARDWLGKAVDYGDLLELPHTTKERDERPRTKWYIPAAFCPALQLPPTRTKEPWYVSADDVTRWIRDAREGRAPTLANEAVDERQLGLSL
jgi:hypothetical protein